MKTIIIVGVFLLIFLNTTYSQTKYSQTELDEMLGTYSFYLGQLHTVNEIFNNHPTYRMNAKTAQDLWNMNFKSSINNIVSELKENYGTRFDEFEIDILDIINKVDYSEVTSNDIEYTIELINKRAKGDMPSPFLETLLAFNPKYQANPEIELINGYYKEYFTKESDKSNGLNIKLKYPRSWKAENGDRPHVIQKFVHYLGYEYGSTLIMIGKLDQALTKKDIALFLSEEGMKHQIPKNSKVLSINSGLMIDNIPASSITVYHEQQQMDNKLGMISEIYILYYKNFQITLINSVGSTTDNYNEIYRRHLTNKKLFSIIANNIVIISQY